MAKKIIIKPVTFSNDDFFNVEIGDNFLYEVQGFAFHMNFYGLFETNLKKFKEPLTKLSVYGDGVVHRFTLLEAPEKWLLKNKFKEDG